MGKQGEMVMAKKVSWMWNKKRYYGTLIRETKTHKFARTSNGKIKKLKKGDHNAKRKRIWFW